MKGRNDPAHASNLRIRRKWGGFTRGPVDDGGGAPLKDVVEGGKKIQNG